ncbi:DMT family transporter [Flavobacterium sp. ASW18X]|uniref:DMT family transporter n=1 Tax=Flavobacterium sp. ASW18X TaxID=2572595 RepID=UPI0010AE1050|nr:DMT family transporter [Flavobacterium sp. ASW18X]TKD65301.1 DMT family transporter [Flavobacterium sp. ASW18X]
MNQRTLAILAAFGATFIYALTHTIAKGVMPDYVQPFGFIQLRVTGAAILFWLISFWGPKEKIDRKDYLRMLVAATLGMVTNMLAFFKGLQLSTPINSAVLITISPIVIVLLSAVFLKEKVSLRKGVGIGLGLVGALASILFGQELRQDAPNIPVGNALLIVNAVSYAGYLILAKKLVEKYHPFTFMKWLFTLAIFINLPVTFTEFAAISWTQMPLWAFGTIAFVVVGTTFCTYLFNIFAMRQLKPSTLGAFIYLQPVMGIIFAVLVGKDQLSPIKVIAGAFVLLGVYLASKKPKPSP